MEEDESAIPKKDSRLMLAKFNEQMEKVNRFPVLRNRAILTSFGSDCGKIIRGSGSSGSVSGSSSATLKDSGFFSQNYQNVLSS